MTSRVLRARARRGALVLAACLAAGLAACKAPDAQDCRARTGDLGAAAVVSGSGAAASPRTMLVPGGRTIAQIAAQVMPSVVSVWSESPAKPSTPEEDEPLEALPFGHPKKHRVEFSLGSGVVLKSDGVILTNNHVIENAREIRVALRDGRSFPAKVVGADPASDIAVLRIDVKGLPAIQVADSTKLQIGDLVLAVGNPFGVGETVTMGIVSGLGRANLGITKYDDFIQTDAAINPGNSGGALVDMTGRLVGVNTAILSKTGGYEGIGFAIPAGMAIKIADELIAHGRVARGWLGVALQDLDDGIARALHVAPDSGALVSEVMPDSPAARAGFQRGDIITAIDGVPITTAAAARNAIALDAPGKAITLRVAREGQGRDVKVKLGEQPQRVARTAQPPAAAPSGLLAGITVQRLDPLLRARLGVPRDLDGVVVTSIAGDSPAGATDLQVGDVVLEIDHTPTPTVRAFDHAASAAGDEVLLVIVRKGRTMYLAIVR